MALLSMPAQIEARLACKLDPIFAELCIIALS